MWACATSSHEAESTWVGGQGVLRLTDSVGRVDGAFGCVHAARVTQADVVERDHGHKKGDLATEHPCTLRPNM